MSEKKDQNARRAGIRWVDIEDIKYDPSYQRDLKKRHKAIATDFMAEAFGVPLVAEREDGTLWCVDGQQRIAGMKLRGESKVRVDVFMSTGREHEAEVFKRVNQDRTKMTAFEIFRAAVTANDEQALELKAAVEECGYRITGGKSGRAAGRNADDVNAVAAKQLTAVAALVNIQKDYKSVEPIKFALRVIDACWPGDRHGSNNGILAGLAIYYSRMKGVVDLSYVIPRLQRVTAYKLLYAAGQATTGNNLQSAVADQVEKWVNKRMMKPK